MRVVDNYGLYYDEETGWWLLDNERPQSILGFSSVRCPFSIRHKALKCPHRISFHGELPRGSRQSAARLQKTSQLFQVMSPLAYTQPRVTYVEVDSNLEANLVFKLQNLTGQQPYTSVNIQSIVSQKLRQDYMKRVSCSNLARGIIWGVTPNDFDFANAVIAEAFWGEAYVTLVGQKLPFYEKEQVLVTKLDPLLNDFAQKFSKKEIQDIGSHLLTEHLIDASSS